MRLARQQVANTVDVMQTGRDPLIWTLAAINHRPYKVGGEVLDDLKVVAEGFKPVAAPDVEVCRWMPKRPKVGIINILMKNGCTLQLDSPMSRQCFVPRLNCFDLLNQLLKRSKNRRLYVLCAGAV